MEQHGNQINSIGIPTSLRPDAPPVPEHVPIFDDLYGVGPEKPMGYLPINTIRRYGQLPESVAEVSERRGLSTLQIDDDYNVPGGSLYVYDELALAHFLEQHADVLARYEWPSGSGDFVERVAFEMVDRLSQPDLYRVIALAFRDPRPEFSGATPDHVSRLRLAVAAIKRRLGL